MRLGQGLLADQAALVEELGDLHRVQRRALAQVVGHDPEVPVSYTHLTLPTIYSV